MGRSHVVRFRAQGLQDTGSTHWDKLTYHHSKLRSAHEKFRKRMLSLIAFGVLCSLAIVACTFIFVIKIDSDSDTNGEGQDAVPPPTERPEQPPEVITIFLQSSNAKQSFVDEALKLFNQTGYTTEDGSKIVVQLVGGGESHLSPAMEPHVYSPANMPWLEEAELLSGKLVSDPDSLCLSVLQIPYGVGMWKSTAQLFGWPLTMPTTADQNKIINEGWEAMGHPELGMYQLGRGNPTVSNSGLSSIVLEVWQFQNDFVPGEEMQLTVEDVWRPEVVEGVRALESYNSNMGAQDSSVLDDMIRLGPAYVDVVPTAESTILELNLERKAEMMEKWNQTLVFLVGNRTFWDEHPFCVLDLAPWSTNQTTAAAHVFLDFLAGREVREVVIRTGYRAPVGGIHLFDSSLISLDNGLLPWLTPQSVPPLPRPSQPVMQAIMDLWREVKRPATACFVLDSSRSMEDTPGGFSSSVQAAQDFVDNLSSRDYLRLVDFSGNVKVLASGKLKLVREDVTRKLSSMSATGVGSKMYSAFDNCMQFAVNRMPAFMPGNWTYVIVIVTDGNGDDLLQSWNRIVALTQQYHEMRYHYQMRIFSILYNTGQSTAQSAAFFQSFMDVSQLAGVSGKVYSNVSNSDITQVYDDILLYW